MIKPTADRLVIKVIEVKDKTEGGLYIPEIAKEKQQLGKVIAAGPKCEEVKKGVTVMFGKYSGSEVRYDNEEYLIIKEEDVLATV